VRALTTLMKDHEIPALATDFFDFEHPLPAVCAFSCTTFSFICLLVFYHYFAYSFLTYSSAGSPIHCFSSSSFRGRTYSVYSCFCCVRSPPRLRTARTEMMPKIHWREVARLRRLLLRIQKILVLIGRGLCSQQCVQGGLCC
jgi:hypothetical protein